jgi:ATP-dependent DNA helicase RecQ
VFGKGDELDAKGWQSVIRQLTAQGLVTVDTGGFGSLHLTDAARAVFRHERTVPLRKDQPKKAAETKRALRKAVELPEPAASLFEVLRLERSKLAKQQGVPPYVIFHDSTLRAMAMARPRSRGEMEELPGMGTTKLDRYGAMFLKVIAAA